MPGVGSWLEFVRGTVGVTLHRNKVEQWVSCTLWSPNQTQIHTLRTQAPKIHKRPKAS